MFHRKAKTGELFASLSVWISPVNRATRSLGLRRSSVRSSNEVFPAPGELMKFRQKTWRSRKRSRNWPAMRSFSLRTFFERQAAHALNLQVSQSQFIAANAACFRRAASRAIHLIFKHREYALAMRALVGAKRTRFEASGSRSVSLTNTSKLKLSASGSTPANSPMAPDLVMRVPFSLLTLLADGVQNRVGNAQFVHGRKVTGNY